MIKTRFQKRVFLTLLNIIAFIVLLKIQDIPYDKLRQTIVEPIEKQQVVIHSALIHQNRIDSNWIAGVGLILLLIMIITYRNWIKIKRWILEPTLIMIILTILTFSYHIYRQFSMAEYLNGL